MKYILTLLMFSFLFSSCSRMINPQTGNTPRRNGGTGTTPRVPAGGNSNSIPTGKETQLVKQAGIKRYYLDVDGTNRTFLVQLPKGYTASKSYPVIFFFHSIRGRDTSWIKNRGANTYVDQHNYIAVYAQGANGGIWNVGTTYPLKPVNEPHFVQAMYDWLKSNADIDTKRVYAVGTSNGAILIHYLIVQMNIFNSVATISGSLYADEMKPSAKPVGVMLFHGTIDKVVPYNGGYNTYGITFLSAQNTAKEWAKVNGCTGEPTIANLLNNKVKAYSYNNCSTGKPVVLYELPNVPHKVMQNFDVPWIYNQIFDFFAKNGEPVK